MTFQGTGSHVPRYRRVAGVNYKTSHANCSLKGNGAMAEDDNDLSFELSDEQAKNLEELFRHMRDNMLLLAQSGERFGGERMAVRIDSASILSAEAADGKKIQPEYWVVVAGEDGIERLETVHGFPKDEQEYKDMECAAKQKDSSAVVTKLGRLNGYTDILGSTRESADPEQDYDVLTFEQAQKALGERLLRSPDQDKKMADKAQENINDMRKLAQRANKILWDIFPGRDM